MKPSVYDFQARLLDGQEISLAEFRGQVLLIVNVASHCSFTPQYEGLEKLHRQYHERGFSVLGFPCSQFMNQEFHDSGKIREFCSTRYDVSFPMFAKIDVNGSNAHPLYRFLVSQAAGWLGVRRIGWNFSKFLIDRQGQVVKRYSSFAKPEQIAQDIETALTGN